MKDEKMKTNVKMIKIGFGSDTEIVIGEVVKETSVEILVNNPTTLKISQFSDGTRLELVPYLPAGLIVEDEAKTFSIDPKTTAIAYSKTVNDEVSTAYTEAVMKMNGETPKEVASDKVLLVPEQKLITPDQF